MRRRFSAMTALVALLGGTTLLLAPPAAAQPYPPGACTATVGSSGDFGAFPVGSTVTLTIRAICTFTGTTATVVVNGQAAGTKPIAPDGTVVVTVTILSPTELSVNPVVRGQCGVNTVSVTGFSASAGTTVTQTATFTVLCPAARPAARAVRGRVAFTGDNIARWSAVALFLVAAGGALVMVDRRRARARRSDT
jgi:hypothetical protein